METQGEQYDVMVKSSSQIKYDSAPDVLHEIGLTKGKEALENGHKHDQDRKQKKLIGILFDEDTIHDRLHQPGIKSRQTGNTRAKKHRDGDPEGVGLHIPE